MTFPAGSTPGGLPYPGTDGEPSDIPLYLENLAQAVTDRLGKDPTGVVWVRIARSYPTDASGIASVTLPGIRAARGFIATPGNGAVVIGASNLYDPAAPGQPGTDAVLPLIMWKQAKSTGGSVHSQYRWVNHAGIGVQLIAWGPAT